MQRVYFNFNYKKATQALNHFTSKEGGIINKMKALKLVYLADRYHLRKYGRLITNDTYLAMGYGPVPSGVKDIAEASELFLGDEERKYSSKYIEPIDRLALKSVDTVDNSVLSESDIEALNFAWEQFGHLEKFELSEITHEYPEWKRHKKALELDSRIQMYLEDFFEDPEGDINKCFELSSQDKTERREYLAETAYIESLWR